MKAITKIVNQEFQPVELTLVFETKEELDSIIRMCSWNISIPELFDYNPDMKQHVKTFLDTTGKELKKHL